MKLTFLGAAHEVTGSCTLVEAGTTKFLVDFGMEQGKDLYENATLPVKAGDIDFVLLTHAHIDHSGNLPLLYKNGFSGPVYATGATCMLVNIMLRDSANIQMQDAEWKSRKEQRAGRPPVEPAYTLTDVEGLVKNLRPCGYGETLQISENVSARFNDAGHLLGSSNIEVWLTENGETRKLLFSGDVGNKNQPILRDPQPVAQADYVIVESTYGDRLHEEAKDIIRPLAAYLQQTFDRGGNVVIPAFAVGRTQEMLYFLREIKERDLVHGHPDFPVYVDSPLAENSTSVFLQCDRTYLDEDSQYIMDLGVNPLIFPGLNIAQTAGESKAINFDPTPKVILSASGMCDAGRIRHHLKHNLWREECTVVFVGYQAEGSLGRRLLEGAQSVKLFGEEIAVRAKIVNFHGLSSHADRAGLLRWITAYNPKPQQVFVVHGDSKVTEIYAQTLREQGIPAHAPNYEEVYDLLANRMLAPGVVLEPKPKAAPVSAAYRRLEDAGQLLLEAIAHNRGGANKDLAKFADQIQALIARWDR